MISGLEYSTVEKYSEFAGNTFMYDGINKKTNNKIKARLVNLAFISA